MKKVKILLLLFFYHTAIFGQSNKALFIEFYQFVKVQESNKAMPAKKNPYAYLPFATSNITYKKKIKKQALDSIVNINSRQNETTKHLFTYNKNGNQESLTRVVDLNGRIHSFRQISFSYNSAKLSGINLHVKDHQNSKWKADFFYKKNVLADSRFFEFKKHKNEWVLKQRAAYRYNQKSEIEEITYYGIDSIGAEKHIRIIKYSYEKDKVIVDEILPKYPLSSDKVYKVKHTFNKNGQLLNIDNTFFNENGEKFTRTDFFIYDEFGQLVNKGYNDDRGNHVVEFYTYNKEHKLTHHSVMNDRHLFSNTAAEIKYDNNGFISEIITNRKHYGYGDYQNEFKYTYVHDRNGNLLDKRYFIWKEENETWLLQTKTIFNFDYRFIATENILHPEFNYFTNDYYGLVGITNYAFDENYTTSSTFYNPMNIHDLIASNNNHWNGLNSKTEFLYSSFGEEVKGNSETYYYSEREVNLNNKTQPRITVHPNPAYNYFTIDLTTMPINTKIKMYNLNGLKVMDQPVFKNELIYINHLQSGLYYFQLFVDRDKVERTGKLMIR